MCGEIDNNCDVCSNECDNKECSYCESVESIDKKIAEVTEEIKKLKEE